MNIQEIRKYYELPIIQCCNLHGVEFRAENSLEPGGDALHKFALVTLDFDQIAVPEISCGLIGNRSAVLSIEFNGPKGVGPKESQDFMECVICALHELKGVVSLTGPSFLALQDRPYFTATLLAGIRVPQELD